MEKLQLFSRAGGGALEIWAHTALLRILWQNVGQSLVPLLGGTQLCPGLSPYTLTTASPGTVGQRWLRFDCLVGDGREVLAIRTVAWSSIGQLKLAQASVSLPWGFKKHSAVCVCVGVPRGLYDVIPRVWWDPGPFSFHVKLAKWPRCFSCLDKCTECLDPF